MRYSKAKCPFWQGDSGKIIKCESLIDDAYSQIQFKNEIKAVSYFVQNCSGCYENCEIYKALMKKYNM